MSMLDGPGSNLIVNACQLRVAFAYSCLISVLKDSLIASMRSGGFLVTDSCTVCRGSCTVSLSSLVGLLGLTM